MTTNIIHVGDSLSLIKTMPNESVNCIITSPPYYALRDYKRAGQIGIEKTASAYIAKLVEVFQEAKRVLKNNGTLWINIGDSYASGAKKRTSEQAVRRSNLKGGKSTQISCKDQPCKISEGLKAKDLIGIPWMLAFALRADGWYLRQEIIWYKRNPMPESVTDRCTRAHENVFMFSKKPQYYYDAEAIKTPPKESSKKRWALTSCAQRGSERIEAKTNGTMKAVGGPYKSLPEGQANIRKARDKQRGHSRAHAGFNERWDNMSRQEQQSSWANKRDVWDVPTKPFKEAHFATFPPDLIKPCVLAGCPEGGVVLDPFFGAGTTGIVCNELNRKWIGVELNEDYAKIAEKRISLTATMFTNL